MKKIEFTSVSAFKHKFIAGFVFLLIILALFTGSLYAQTYVYVKHDASGSSNGTSWANAYTSLHAALVVATTGHHIWVAAGTYKPEQEVGGTGDRFKTFQLKNGVAVYGGFAGTEDPATFDLNNRNFVANETILSGDLGGGVNVYHVFRHVNLGLNSTAILDGFTISGGKADGSDPDNKGGGMLNSVSSSTNGSSPTIRNCVFKNNEATEGGALYNSRYCSPAVSKTTFTNNTAATKGGAVFNIRNTPTFISCTFTGNEVTGSADNDGGGAIYNATSAAAEGPVISHCLFTNNIVPSSGTATYGGGAIFSSLDPGTISITFSTFTGNTGKYGGAIYHRSGNNTNRDNSEVKISNSTFEQNNAEYGGAIFSDRHNTQVTACIIRGNQAVEQSGGYYGRLGSSRLINTLLSGNKSGKHGGGVYFNTETPELINTTVAGNFSGERGGGISMIGGSTVAIKNTIVWGNASPEGNQVWLCSNCTANIDYSLYGNATGDVFITSGGILNATNSLTVNPSFVSPVVPTTGNTPNTGGNYQLQTSSPAIDAGSNSHLPSGITTDLLGNNRIVKGSISSGETIDMGAYEYAGDGSVNNPFLISNRIQLENVNNNLSAHYRVVNDIDLSDVIYDRAVISFSTGTGLSFVGTKFTGTLNGDGFKIINLNINGGANNYIGLFGHIGAGSKISNLNFENCTITGNQYVGVLAGRIDGTNPTVEFIQTAGILNGKSFVGGLIGSISGATIIVNQCASSAVVNGETNTGGLLGFNEGGTVQGSHATGNVTGVSAEEQRVGGLVGRNAGKIVNSYATGNVISDRSYVGGLVGFNNIGGEITKSYAIGNISGRHRIGGLVGHNEGLISGSYATGSATGEQRRVGGLAGVNKGTSGIIVNSYATGNAISTTENREFVGGLVGENDGGTIRHSFALGSAVGNLNIGGLVGENKGGSIYDSYARGYATGTQRTAGLVGQNASDGIISNTFSTGLVSASGFGTGGLIGNNSSGTISNSFWDTQTSGKSSSSGGTGETTANMKTLATFTMAGWDFTDIWAINTGVNDGYPHLRFSSFSWTGFVDSDWSKANNWNPAQLPSFDNSVTIPGNLANYPILDQNRTIGSLTVAAGASLSIPPQTGLTVNGTLTNNATPTGLVIKSDVTGTGSLIQSTAGVEATMQRYIPAAIWGVWDDGWHNLSSPVAAQAIYPGFVHGFDLGTEDFYKWDEPTNTWINIKNAGGTGWSSGFETEFVIGRGYLVAYNSDVTKIFSGTLNVSDVAISGLTISGGKNRSWHLLGNPYSSALTWYTDWTTANIGGVAKIWNGANKSYSDRSAGAAIPATNGFMVQVSQETGSLTIPAAKRTHSSQAFFKNSPGVNIMLTARNLNHPSAQESIICTNPAATKHFDLEFDSEFLAGFAPQFYSVAGVEKLSTNCLPELTEETVIPFDFIKNEGTNFSIEAAGIETLEPVATVFLKDKKLGISHNLSENPVYQFTSTQNDAPARFELHFSPVGIEELPSASQLHVYVEGNQLFVMNPANGKARIEVYNVQGQMMMKHEIAGGLQAMPMRLAPGTYLVRLIADQATKATKIVIQ